MTNSPVPDSIPCQSCSDTGKVGGRRCRICNGEPLTYSTFENLQCYLRTINLNVPDVYRQPQLDLSMVRMRQDIDAFWKYLENAYEIEPRSYFEEKYKIGKCGDATPLQMAAHYLWKRSPKVTSIVDSIKNLMGLLDTPLGRRRMPGEFAKDVVADAKLTLAAVENPCLNDQPI